MDDPRREGYLHQSGAAGLPTGSIRDIIPYVVFLSLHSDFSILSVILPQEIRDTAAAMPQIPTVPMLSQFSVSALSNRSAFHTNCHVLYRVISCAPTTPALPPGNPAQSAYILRSDCVSRYCLILSAPTHISSQSTCDGSPLWNQNSFGVTLLTEWMLCNILVTDPLPCTAVTPLGIFIPAVLFIVLCFIVLCSLQGTFNYGSHLIHGSDKHRTLSALY